MPNYEYRRPDGSTFELQQSFHDEPLTVDPDSGVPVERVLHAPAVHFKGKGFYNTDYGTRNRQRESASADGDSSAKPSESKRDSSDGESKAKANGKESGSKDSKPVAAAGKG